MNQATDRGLAKKASSTAAEQREQRIGRPWAPALTKFAKAALGSLQALLRHFQHLGRVRSQRIASICQGGGECENSVAPDKW